MEHRQASRHLVKLTKATVRQPGEQPANAALHDISTFGCRVLSPIDHAPGERLWLRFQGSAAVAATVIWHDAGFVGCRFDQPIDRTLMRSLILT